MLTPLDLAREVKARLSRKLHYRRAAPVNLKLRDSTRLESDVSYAVQVARNYLKQFESAHFDLQSSKILELGPGIDFGPQLILASHGARVTVADRFLSCWDESYHPQFYRLLRSRWNGPAGALDAVIEANGYPENAIGQIAEAAEELHDVPAGIFDLVLSNAVLEHVWDVKRVARNLARITKSHGLNLHQVDYRDHRDFSRPLEFLLLSSRTHHNMFKRMHGEVGNRSRLSECVAAFRAAGFNVVEIANKSMAQDDYFRDFVPRLRRCRSAYRDWPVDDLRILGARLELRK